MDRSVSPALRPWGARRAKPFTGVVEAGYARLELDPETQMTRYLDEAGQPLEMGRHGTNKPQTRSEKTGGDGGGPNPPQPQDDVNITEYVQD